MNTPSPGNGKSLLDMLSGEQRAGLLAWTESTPRDASGAIDLMRWPGWQDLIAQRVGPLAAAPGSPRDDEPTMHGPSLSDRILAALLKVEAIHGVRVLGAHCNPDQEWTYVVDIAGIGEGIGVAVPRPHPAAEPDTGKVGYLTRSRADLAGRERFRSEAKFYAYLDQSLRRDPLLDSDTELGWVCDAKPSGFSAPRHIVPGTDGAYIPAKTTAVTLAVPEEFVALCSRYQVSAEAALRGFIADAAGLQNFISCPRADRYQSNGSDERDQAADYLRRAYGHLELSPEDEDDRLEAQAAAQEREYRVDELVSLLDAYVEAGCDGDDLIALVEQQVERKQAEMDGSEMAAEPNPSS
ncbi:hypothetical protein H8Z72_22550 (plasmid) [Xanthomonas citri pv. citri]|uniref:hypothetical protein n=1 Tax=Xanthomonas citri TaxID=346 RepID=UPI001932B20F|nr:hypothetical protein [Xanthomonas citri]QRD62689.1 hypothetical protein H8Z74_23635 [Xanthomonas citri pv. citri]QRD67224.1 hypothetical protein H8Z73_22615 [Xanthomonas citri pv. citri]QRD71731.1 hypothetical protein H8Z72_22550 [Xanthomonas citri pv. citri]